MTLLFTEQYVVMSRHSTQAQNIGSETVVIFILLHCFCVPRTAGFTGPNELLLWRVIGSQGREGGKAGKCGLERHNIFTASVDWTGHMLASASRLQRRSARSGHQYSLLYAMAMSMKVSAVVDSQSIHHLDKRSNSRSSRSEMIGQGEQKMIKRSFNSPQKLHRDHRQTPPKTF